MLNTTSEKNINVNHNDLLISKNINFGIQQENKPILVQNKVFYNTMSKEFVITNNDENEILSIAQIANYITHTDETQRNGESGVVNINNDSIITGTTFIEKYLVKKETTSTGFIQFKIVKIPPITTNYNHMFVLIRELSEIEDTSKTSLLKRFIVNLIQYVIKMLAVIIETQTISKDIKNSIFLHAIVLHSHVTNYVTTKVIDYQNQFVTLQSSLQNIDQLQTNLSTKQTHIEKILLEQNSLIELAIDKIEKHHNNSSDIDSIKGSIRNITDKIDKLSLNSNSNSNSDHKYIKKGGFKEDKSKKNHYSDYKHTSHKMESEHSENSINKFDEHYLDSESVTKARIQKIESSPYSALLNV